MRNLYTLHPSFVKAFWVLLLFIPIPIGTTQNQENTSSDIASNIGQVQALALDEVLVRTGIAAWQVAGYSGTGIHIGILNQGFGGIETYATNQDNLSLNIAPNLSIDDLESDPNSQGTQALQIIHRIAPNAQFHVCQYTRLDSFSACIDWFSASHVRIVHHGTGIIFSSEQAEKFSREAERAFRSGMLWLNAAGDIDTGILQDTFTAKDFVNHEFNINQSISLSVEAVPVSRVIGLTWSGNSQHDAESIDLDLEIWDENGNLMAASQAIQEGEPGTLVQESVVVEAEKSFKIRVLNRDGRGEGTAFTLTIQFGQTPDSASGQSILAPTNNSTLLSIGVLQGRDIAPYSSRGPLPPGSIKPDFVAPGEIELDEDNLAVGTSAAAAIVSAAAALIWEANPAWNNEQLRNHLLTATQDDRTIPGPDFVYGYGRLFLNLPESQSSTSSTAQADNNLVEIPPLEASSTAQAMPIVDYRNMVFLRNLVIQHIDASGNIHAINVPGRSYDPDLNGSLIAYASARNNERLDIYLYNLETGQETRLTGNPEQDRHPAISPNGQVIAFSSNREGQWDIFLINTDGTNERRLTTSSAFEYAASWRSDGNALAYQSNQNGSIEQLYIHDLQSNEIQQLTNSSEPLVGAIWSPDGQYIASYINADPPIIVIVNAETGRQQSYIEGTPSGWLNSNIVLFHRRIDENTVNIYILDITTGASRLLVENGSWASASP